MVELRKLLESRGMSNLSDDDLKELVDSEYGKQILGSLSLITDANQQHEANVESDIVKLRKIFEGQANLKLTDEQLMALSNTDEGRQLLQQADRLKQITAMEETATTSIPETENENV